MVIVDIYTVFFKRCITPFPQVNEIYIRSTANMYCIINFKYKHFSNNQSEISYIR